MRYMVTGAAGFIGSQLSQTLVARGDEVLGVDCITPYYEAWRKEANLEQLREHEAFRLLTLDLRIDNLTGALDGVDVVIHLAGQPGVRTSWGTDFGAYVGHNIKATQRLLEAAVSVDLRRFVFASSSSIYGNAAVFPTSESALPRPFSPYGVTKLAAEHLCGVYAANWGLSTVSLRYFTVYGPRQRPDMGFHRFIEAAIDGCPIELYGTGAQRRDFTHVDDVVAATLLAAESSAPADPALNVAGGSQVRITEVLDQIGEILGRRLDVRRTREVPGDVDQTGADCAAIRALLGWQPRMDLASGLMTQVEWHLANRARQRAMQASR
jgi:UDP-glucuronate 4-epimerase